MQTQTPTKTQLHDGNKRVDNIAVTCLVRNNAEWLHYAVQKFKEMEEFYDTKFTYYFFENDSTDDTVYIIQHFISQAGRNERGSKIFSETMPSYKNLGVNFERTDRLASLRNRLKKLITPLQQDWVLMVDTEIFFHVDTLHKLFMVEPAKNNIAMVCPYATEIYTGKMIKKQNPNANANIPDSQIFTSNHYYDTFAFVDDNGKNYWPNCNFAACNKCNKNQPNLIPKHQNIVDVDSAYGGFCIIQTMHYNHPAILWKSIDLFGKFATCEHILFCAALRASSQKRIVVHTHANQVQWTKT